MASGEGEGEGEGGGGRGGEEHHILGEIRSPAGFKTSDFRSRTVVEATAAERLLYRSTRLVGVGGNLYRRLRNPTLGASPLWPTAECSSPSNPDEV